MAELKTKRTRASVARFLAGVGGSRAADCEQLVRIMRDITGEEPAMWGKSIVGFGSYRFRYASGREGEWFTCGFSPRKQDLTLYVMAGFSRYEELLADLGTFRHGKSCLYVKGLDRVHLPTLKKLLRASVAHVRKSSVE